MMSNFEALDTVTHAAGAKQAFYFLMTSVALCPVLSLRSW